MLTNKRFYVGIIFNAVVLSAIAAVTNLKGGLWWLVLVIATIWCALDIYTAIDYRRATRTNTYMSKIGTWYALTAMTLWFKVGYLLKKKG